MKTKKCPKCGSKNTHDHWTNPDDHGLIIIHNWRCHDCGWDDSKKPMTNGDKIRQMSDEELAKFIWSTHSCAFCPFGQMCDETGITCPGNYISWLKQEAKDE